MTSIGDMLGDMAHKLAQSSINIGDVHLINLDQTNGITPKDGDSTRYKFFVVLGFDNEGNIIGGLVINSKINHNLPTSITDYQIQVTPNQLTFLYHKSYVNCSKIITAHRDKFTKDTYRGAITDTNLLQIVIKTVIESPTTSKKLLKQFGIK